MADGTILCRGQVVNELANTDLIVMTQLTVIYNASMIVGASSEGTRRVAYVTILCGSRHMIGMLTDRAYSVTGVATIAYNIWASVIDEKVCKILSIMACSTISRCYWVILHLRITQRVNTIVASCAW